MALGWFIQFQATKIFPEGKLNWKTFKIDINNNKYSACVRHEIDIYKPNMLLYSPSESSVSTASCFFAAVVAAAAIFFQCFSYFKLRARSDIDYCQYSWIMLCQCRFVTTGKTSFTPSRSVCRRTKFLYIFIGRHRLITTTTG